MPIFLCLKKPIQDSVLCKKEPLEGGWIYTSSSFKGHALLCILSLVGRTPALPTSVSDAMQRYGEYLCFPNLLC